MFTTTTKYYGLGPNTYIVYARDNLGCIRDTTITITQPDSFSFSFSEKDATCYGGDDGSLQFSVTGASPPYLYAFEAGNFNNDTIHTNLHAGTYTIRVKDNNNCLLLRKITISQPPRPLLLPAEIVRATWNDDSTVLLQWKKYPKALRYKIESIFLVNDVVADTFYYQKLPQTDIYEYRISVIDSCNFQNQISLMHNTLLLKGRVDDSKTITLNWNSYKNWQYGVLNYNIYKYDVSTNRFNIAYVTSDTTYTIPVKPEDTLSEYIFYVEAIEQNGNLATSVSNKVYLYTSPVVWMPNIFSPNNDGLNDYPFPMGVGIKNYTFTIYNRWGEVLFKTDDITRQWDGKFEGTEAPVGTYIFELQANCYLERKVEKQFFIKGSVQLVR